MLSSPFNLAPQSPHPIPLTPTALSNAGWGDVNFVLIVWLMRNGFAIIAGSDLQRSY